MQRAGAAANEDLVALRREVVALDDEVVTLRSRIGSARHQVAALRRELAARSQSAETVEESRIMARHRARRVLGPRISPPLRVLYALEFFPHVSESYIATEIAWMRRQGVEIEAWSEREPPVPEATEVIVHRGSLAAAIAAFRPRIVHGHHLEQALGYAPIVGAAGLPMTVRAHGFTLDVAKRAAIDASDAIVAVFHFPHMVGPVSAPGAEKIRPMTCCFDPDVCYPQGRKDPRLVVRTGLASPTKDLGMFLRLAMRFPRHRFVLIPCWSFGMPDHLDELLAQNRALGDPVEILPNLPHAEVVDITRAAGVYLHTHALLDDYGMPISIAEAMATGCYVIARRGPSTEAFLDGAGSVYDTEDQAAELLRATEGWDGERWRRARIAALDRAHGAFAAPDVLPPLLEEWVRLVDGWDGARVREQRDLDRVVTGARECPPLPRPAPTNGRHRSAG